MYVKLQGRLGVVLGACMKGAVSALSKVGARCMSRSWGGRPSRVACATGTLAASRTHGCNSADRLAVSAPSVFTGCGLRSIPLAAARAAPRSQAAEAHLHDAGPGSAQCPVLQLVRQDSSALLPSVQRCS